MSRIGIDVKELVLIAGAISLRSIAGAPRKAAFERAAKALAILSAANVEAVKSDCPVMPSEDVPQAFSASEIDAWTIPVPVHIGRTAYSASMSLMALQSNCDGCEWSPERMRALSDLQSDMLGLLREALALQVNA